MLPRVPRRAPAAIPVLIATRPRRRREKLLLLELRELLFAVMRDGLHRGQGTRTVPVDAVADQSDYDEDEYDPNNGCGDCYDYCCSAAAAL
jgi:hypothetical protein